MKLLFAAIPTIALFATSLLADSGPFLEQDGNVVMEAESVTPGEFWEFLEGTYTEGQLSTEGYTGAGCLRFTGNTEMSGPAVGPTYYPFRISSAGTYQIYMHGYGAPLESGEDDYSNDCFIRIETQNSCELTLAAPNPDCHAASCGSNGRFVIVGTVPWRWKYNFNLECGGEGSDEFIRAQYAFEPGDYTLVVSGRSKNFIFDRIIITTTLNIGKKDTQGLQWLTDLSESPRAGDGTAVSPMRRSRKSTIHSGASEYNALYGIDGRLIGNGQSPHAGATGVYLRQTKNGVRKIHMDAAR